MTSKKIRVSSVFLVLILYLLIFQNLLTNYFKPIQYFDEVLALLVFPIGFFRLSNRNSNNHIIKKDDLIMICALLAIFAVGLYSNFVYKMQPANIYMSDALLVFKFFLVYLLSKWIWKDNIDNKQKKFILKHTKVIIFILFLLTIANYLFGIWPWEIRFGIMTNKLFYSQPTVLAASCIFLLSLLIMCSEKISKLDFIALSLVLLSTLRFKAIGAALIIALIVIYVYKTKKKISVTKFGILAFLALVLAWDQINFYYIDSDNSARNQLTIKSIEIAKDYFPVGSGFGTYASHMSGVNYSPMYYKYGLSGIYGLVKGHVEFISDTFWPMIIGQFGFIGFICYLITLVIIFKRIQNEFNISNINIYVSKIVCFVYLVISSTSEAAFVNPVAIPLAIMLAI